MIVSAGVIAVVALVVLWFMIVAKVLQLEDRIKALERRRKA